ncbi:MAG: hypothetical protein K2K41_05865 [Ruminiclostridium sp.]|nr:hypothetical protein [Ruminiclostridium sp.]
MSFVIMAIHPIKAFGVSLPVLARFMLGLTFPGLIIVIPAGVFWICSFTLESVFALHMSKEDIEKNQ